MSLDSSSPRPSRARSTQDVWPRWMWVAVPVLVAVVVGIVYWFVIPPGDSETTPTPSPTMKIIRPEQTQAPTLYHTLAAEPTATTRSLLPQPTFTATRSVVTTPTGRPTPSLRPGAKASVSGTGGQGLQLRSGADTGHARIKTLAEGAVVEILDGPKQASGYTWWQVRDEVGTTGWVADEWLVGQ